VSSLGIGGCILAEIGSYSADHSSISVNWQKPRVRGETFPGPTTTLSEVARLSNLGFKAGMVVETK
jgi:hypothetical protein